MYITTYNPEGRTENHDISALPDSCPVCHASVTVDPKIAFFNPYSSTNRVQVVFWCPNNKCRAAFVGIYSGYSGTLYLESLLPIEPQTYEFTRIISELSPDFVELYDQAYAAEQVKLSDICGCGYRKALEFLVKDYVLSVTSEDEEKEKIKDESLAHIISKRVQNSNIKEVAKRATWLGNDETHYVRKWTSKVLKDLKELINLVVNWIEMEIRTKQLQVDMPE